MKLKDKIECTLQRHVKLKENQSENIEQIADHYAIGFEEFKEKYNNSHRIYKQGRELLEIYKKTL